MARLRRWLPSRGVALSAEPRRVRGDGSWLGGRSGRSVRTDGALLGHTGAGMLVRGSSNLSGIRVCGVNGLVGWWHVSEWGRPACGRLLVGVCHGV